LSESLSKELQTGRLNPRHAWFFCNKALQKGRAGSQPLKAGIDPDQGTRKAAVSFRPRASADASASARPSLANKTP